MVAHVRDGTLDMARVNISALDMSGSATIVPSLPFLFKSTAHMRRVLDGPIGDEILAGLEAQGLVGLCFYDAGPALLLQRQAADQGARPTSRAMKVRVQQTDVWAASMRALGAEPVSTPFDARLLCALESGTVGAADNNWPSMRRHAPLQRGEVLQPDRALDGAGGADLLQAHLGRALARGPGHRPQRRQGSCRPHAQAVG